MYVMVHSSAGGLKVWAGHMSKKVELIESLKNNATNPNQNP